MTTLANRALLTSLSISQWSARKYDKRETAELALKHGTVMNIARVNKSLLPGAENLEAIHKRTNAIRWDYYNHSLPWGQDGVNVIKAEGYMDFVAMMRDHMYEWRALVKDFVAIYPSLQQEARATLNGLYRDEDYPHPDTLARKFNIDVKFFPVPSSKDWRVSLADEELEELRKAVNKQVWDSEAVAMSEAWKRIHDLVERTRERLADPKAVFRDSLVENAKDLCKVLPSLNISDNPAMERIRSELEASICAHTPEVLRTAPDVRADVAKKMADIQAKLGAFYSAS